ncbi:uncharacterized protein LOC129573174 [Sitodiplosis mosellana]|uniref:uncharacterized protein LOC129573174 n=1 Tax=Sitodiplosis mosellana TaxID=263140 RepID=UPI0024441218|nr:uncharacterized protein LOC129573174 [Sitodiplosis mosellana]
MSDQVRSFCEIKEFGKFLEKCLNQKVLDYTLKSLTKPGDNYGSIMQSVDVEVIGESDTEESEILHLVSKTAVTNPYLIEIFQPAFTFVKETHFYSDIIPAIEIFETMKNVPKTDRIDAFIPCPGSRISLNPDASCADADAVLLLENIKFQNYVNEDRHIGFDTETTMAILKTLAQFHAHCIAIRRMQPELFDAKISPYLKAVNLCPDDNDTKLVDGLCNELKFVDDLDPEFRIAIEEQLKICDKFGRDTTRTADTPYTTIVHRDLWTNNIMIKKDDIDVSVIKVKIYDFQLYFYQTFVCDLIFFLLTSVRSNDLTKHFKLFIRQYHLEFVNTMKLVNCPCDDYTFDKMWNEIKEKSKLELYHSLFMIKVVAVDESETPLSLDDVTPDTFLTDESPSKAILNRWKCILAIFKDNGLI